VARQTANDYTTSFTGLKFEIAHERAVEKSAAHRRGRSRTVQRDGSPAGTL
jgi:hypothetical protein